MHRRYALSADRRAQIRQASARPCHQLRNGYLRCAQSRAGLHRLDHAIEPLRRHADRSFGVATRHLRSGADLPDRARRAVFYGFARAMVRRLARSSYRHTAAALRQPALKPKLKPSSRPQSQAAIYRSLTMAAKAATLRVGAGLDA